MGLPLNAAPLADARWPEVAAAKRRVLLVPVGSLEQHGPHLPLDTDLRIAVAAARQACDGRSDVVLAPGIPFGASGEHADFPGTLSVGTAALTSYLVELGRHVGLHWPALVLANAHGGNAPAVRAAADLLAGEGRTCLDWHASLPEGDAHAGRTETSLMLAIAPDAVRLDLAAAGNTQPLRALMPAMREHGVRAVSRNGVLGDPHGASAAEGARLLDDLAAALGHALDEAVAHTVTASGGCDAP